MYCNTRKLNALECVHSPQFWFLSQIHPSFSVRRDQPLTSDLCLVSGSGISKPTAQAKDNGESDKIAIVSIIPHILSGGSRRVNREVMQTIKGFLLSAIPADQNPQILCFFISSLRLHYNMQKLKWQYSKNYFLKYFVIFIWGTHVATDEPGFIISIKKSGW